MLWSMWLSLDTLPDYNGAAVYQLRLVVEGKPVPIPRLLGTDSEGILVIGCTGNMTRRYWQIQQARNFARGSSTANLLFFWERYTPLSQVFTGFSYQYRYPRPSSFEEAKMTESRLLKQYVCKFADRPPLNSILPNRYEGWEDASV